ncbi:MAG: TVP38/TMEM64 family protein [Candidatus Binataceae bacterium]
MDSRPGRLRVLLSIKVICAAIAAVALFALVRTVGAAALLSGALDWIASLGRLAPVVFVATYIVATVMLMPGSILTIGAGALFGVVWGSIYASISATLGATAAFLVGRYVARDWIAAKVENNPKFSAIDEAVGREGWKIVGLTRLSPIFPFNLLNYAYGLTRVRLRDYFFASWIGMMPGTVLYVYIGSLGRDLASKAAGGESSAPSTARWIINIVGFVATLLVAIYATRIGARALREKT